MNVVADLHSHSKYARAVSSQMVLPMISSFCRKKGIDVASSGDWTHPLWFRELQEQLEEKTEGVYGLKSGAPTLFLLSTEVAVIYTQGGRQRRIHLLIFAPSFEVVAKINNELTRLGKNLFSDGRPILGMSAHDLAQLVFEIDERSLIIPAHAWTPWFGVFGSMSGFETLEECFGDIAKYIYGIETGLSSDPGMNWGIADLDNRAILSFSDAHSPAKLGRELTVFDLEKVSYRNIRNAIIGKELDRISYTIEFYPEEGKYHYNGHRNCGVIYSPEETKELGIYCPKCNRPLTLGVMHRVDQLTDQRTKNEKLKTQKDEFGVSWKSQDNKSPYVSVVPLLEIIAEVYGVLVGSKKVGMQYENLVNQFGSELNVLLSTKVEEIVSFAGPKFAEAITKVRTGDISIEPGYDGVFGKVKIWEKETHNLKVKSQNLRNVESQMGLF